MDKNPLLGHFHYIILDDDSWSRFGAFIVGLHKMRLEVISYVIIHHSNLIQVRVLLQSF